MQEGPATLAERLVLARKARGLSQGDVAEAIGMTQPSYSALERGVSKTTHKIGSLARLLGVDAYWLETGEGPMRVGEEEPPPYLSPARMRALQIVGFWSEERVAAFLELFGDR